MKRIALIGAKHGPWTAIKWVKEPVLRVTGLEAGAVEIELMCAGCPTPLVSYTMENGDTDLRDLSSTFAERGFEWIRLHASRPTRSLICVVLPKAA